MFVFILYFAQDIHYLYNICCFLLSAIPVFAGHVPLCLSLTKIFVIFTLMLLHPIAQTRLEMHFWFDVQIGVNILWFSNVSA